MGILQVIPFAHSLLHRKVVDGDIVIDCTMGNGHDTLFLAKLVGKTGHVYSFDIQRQALVNTKRLFREDNFPFSNYSLIKSNHTLFSTYLQEEHKQITAAIFNLGYLPGSNKSIVTTPKSTISALKSLLPYMRAGGIIILVLYPGHPEGKIECEAVINYVVSIQRKVANVLQYRFLNYANNPPFVLAIEKN